jgi:hypothetical protein
MQVFFNSLLVIVAMAVVIDARVISVQRHTPVPQFPSVQFKFQEGEVILKSRKWGSALAVVTDQNGEPQLVTRALQSEEDPQGQYW